MIAITYGIGGHRPSFRGHSTYRRGLPRRRGTDRRTSPAMDRCATAEGGAFSLPCTLSMQAETTKMDELQVFQTVLILTHMYVAESNRKVELEASRRLRNPGKRQNRRFSGSFCLLTQRLAALHVLLADAPRAQHATWADRWTPSAACWRDSAPRMMIRLCKNWVGQSSL